MTLDDLREMGAAALAATTVADVLGVDVRTVTRACRDGQLPSIHVGRRLLIPREPLIAMLEAQPEAS